MQILAQNIYPSILYNYEHMETIWTANNFKIIDISKCYEQFKIIFRNNIQQNQKCLRYYIKINTYVQNNGNKTARKKEMLTSKVRFLLWACVIATIWTKYFVYIRPNSLSHKTCKCFVPNAKSKFNVFKIF